MSLSNQALNILLINTESGFGGREVHTVHMYETLKKSGHNPFLLITRGSKLESELIKRQIPYYACTKIKLLGRRFPFLKKQLEKICRLHDIQIIHSDVEKNLLHAKKLPVKVVYTHHRSNPLSTRTLKSIKNIDVAIGVSEKIKTLFDEANIQNNTGIKHTTRIAPFFDQDKFTNYNPSETKQEFFKKLLGITLHNKPVITCIARLEKDKCHDLLFSAIHQLIHEKRIPVELMLAGSGPEQNNLKELVKKLNIQNYVHFLGYTDNTAALLHHSDIKVVASKKDEGCPISLIEASLMKKPLVASPGMGTEHSVVHEKTGLFFENNNPSDLALQLERLIQNPKWAKVLGEAAYENVMATLSVETSVRRLLNLYASIL